MSGYPAFGVHHIAHRLCSHKHLGPTGRECQGRPKCLSCHNQFSGFDRGVLEITLYSRTLLGLSVHIYMVQVFVLKCLFIKELDNLLYRMYCFVQRKTNSTTLFLQSAKQNEHNQQQQNNVPQVVRFFLLLLLLLLRTLELFSLRRLNLGREIAYVQNKQAMVSKIMFLSSLMT